MIRITTEGDGQRPKLIDNGGSTSRVGGMATPNTLARIEDPRAWHARGEVGIQQLNRKSQLATDAIALPMAPPLPEGRPIRARKVVLEEDEYVERLGDIIEGDYFPHNAKMYRALSSLAEGVHGGGGSNTPSGRDRAFVGTPSSVVSATPGASTPGRDASGLSGVGKEGSKRAMGTGGALTAFVARHTSEDNEAFAELQEKDQEAFRRRNFWAYETFGDGGMSSKLLILPDGKIMSAERRKQMDAACADRPKIGDDRPNQVETWKHRTRNQLMFSPNMAASRDTCRLEQDKETAAPLRLEGGGSEPRAKRRLIKALGEADQASQLRVGDATGLKKKPIGSSDPIDTSRRLRVAGLGEDAEALEHSHAPAADASAMDQSGAEGPADASPTQLHEGGTDGSHSLSDDDSVPGSPNRHEGASSRAEESAASRAPVLVKTNPKVIQAHATRFPVPKPRPPRQGAWASPIERPSSSRESVAGLLAGTTDTADYAEVPMTPSRVPGIDGDSPQITWGSIEGTPMILDPRATPVPTSSLAGPIEIESIVGAMSGSRGGQQFEMKDLPARDKLAHRLEAVDTRRKRAKLGPGAPDGRGTRTPTPATPLTPGTPGTGRRTPGTGLTSVGGRTPGKARSRTVGTPTAGAASAAAAASLTPAARTLAAKLARRRTVTTPFGGGLTPGRQKKRSRSRKGGGTGEDGLTPLPSTPGGGGRSGPVTPGVAKRTPGVDESTRSSLTDGLLAIK